MEEILDNLIENLEIDEDFPTNQDECLKTIDKILTDL